ncbi:hypothetical protein HCG51_29415 [Tolypothrix sp. PCC 7910]|uniref:CTB family bacteriocin n=1 Tax=Tolypothrix sp. PCC 7910 TaxID=2099387 RepID=UPI0014277A70|nr:CTB family bacteriocin [Tolypothrix sp. PCC 7910]QIR40404.1 hypothetical protein HCG51_29415 [Tolypothrix sp. PCC 7910]
MSDNKPMELSAEELDNVAGGAVSEVAAVSDINLDTQASLLNIGAGGGIQSAQTQTTTESKQALNELKLTGEFPGVPSGFFGSK